MSSGPPRLSAACWGMSLPEAVATAAYEFITGPLLRDPYRIGTRLLPPMDDRFSVRRVPGASTVSGIHSRAKRQLNLQLAPATDDRVAATRRSTGPQWCRCAARGAGRSPEAGRTARANPLHKPASWQVTALSSAIMPLELATHTRRRYRSCEVDHSAGDVDSVIGQTLVEACHQRHLHRHR